MAQTLIGNETWSNEIKRGQVYLATHDGEGNPLSVSRKSFISFSWGGRAIEEFDLIAVTGGDRLQRSLMAPFEDTTSEYEVLDGQYYWRSHYKPYTINFTLATDGVLERTLQDFRNYFIPGKIRKLVLAEAPNRVGYARVSTAPTFSLLPFEEQVNKTIGGKEYKSSTTMWRGEVSLSFILDEPFWYAENTILDFNNSNNLQEDDLVKIYIEDGVPFVDMFKTSCLIGENKKVTYSEEQIELKPQTVINSVDDYSAAISNLSANNPIISSESSLRLYYPGTAPAKPILTFALLPTFNDDGYIDFPKNSYVADEDEVPHNYIKVGNNIFTFTTPNILTSYNQTLSMIDDYQVGDSIIDIENGLRGSISDYYMRGWACGVCKKFKEQSGGTYVDNTTSQIKEGFHEEFKKELKKIFLPPTQAPENSEDQTHGETDTTTEQSNEILPFYFTFDSSNGNSKVYFYINKFRNPSVKSLAEAAENNEEAATETVGEYENENAGDMVRSNYLLIEDRTLPNSSDTITDDECLEITTDANLLDFGINYEYTYL